MDASTWRVIGSMAINEEINLDTVFDFMHKTNVVGEHYYRINILTNSGLNNYSGVVVVERNESIMTVIYPNPSSGKIIVECDDQLISHWQVVSNSGNNLRKGSIVGTSLELNFYGFPSGEYRLLLYKDDKLIESHPFVILK